MEHSAILRSHSLRVMGTVDKFMSRIDSQEKSRGVIIELGQRHDGYNAKSEYFGVSSNKPSKCSHFRRHQPRFFLQISSFRSMPIYVFLHERVICTEQVMIASTLQHTLRIACRYILEVCIYALLCSVSYFFHKIRAPWIKLLIPVLDRYFTFLYLGI